MIKRLKYKKWKKLIEKSGLFDVKYYLFTYPDIRAGDINPVMHYIQFGAQEGRNPSAQFNTNRYLSHYPDAAASDLNPLVHYILFGKEQEDKERYLIDQIKESDLFDKAYYLEMYPDVAASGVDPVYHYLKHGAYEGRDPSRHFSTKYYLDQYPDVKAAKVNPLAHYLTNGRDEGRLPKPIDDNNFFDFCFEQNNKVDADHIAFELKDNITTDLRLIAFYLPQFHPLEVNDKAWGKGFTEWTNVSKAIPQFEGHYQPRLPGELGFYDLRQVDIQREQIRLAKNYGLHGFCYHYYWFDGQTIMDTPLQQILNNLDLDFPFCINWANENWTKRWDGLDHEVILKQNHSLEDDIKFLEAIKPILSDHRYIKIQGKALLMIYRPQIFPDIKETVSAWREHARQIGLGELYLVLTHSFDTIDPTEIGFDAATEFAPNGFPLKSVTAKYNMFNKKYDGIIYDYADAIAHSKTYLEPSYTKFRGICPGWDNEARKPGKGTSLVNSSPGLFKEWLDYILDYTDKHRKVEEKIVFINAWNEWAEGAYLEPDRKFGYAYLDAIHKALLPYNRTKKIIYVSHDAHFHGAQMLSLNIIRTLKERFHLDVHLLLKSGGKLETEFKKYASVYNLEQDYQTVEDVIKLIETLKHSGANNAICNTVVSGDITTLLSQAGLYTINLIHELPQLIRDYGMEENAMKIAEYADLVVFPSAFVKEGFEKICDLPPEKVVIRPQGLYQHNPYLDELATARETLRHKLDLPASAKIILGAGYADYRKGFDLFIETAQKVSRLLPDAYFLWVGDIEQSMQKHIDDLDNPQDFNLIFIPAQPEISLYYSGADLYLMTSREDPFPSVILEAMNARVPVVGFENAGGFGDLVTSERGRLVSYENSDEMAASVVELLKNEALRDHLGNESQHIIQNDFVWKDYVYHLLELVGMPYKKVSVIVPNYNYERYIHERLSSIEKQSYPVYELIYLDDCSTDSSLHIARSFLSHTKLDMTIFENNVNSGSVFKQWAKGIDLSRGDYIWIAEADDLCTSTFLNHVMPAFNDEKMILSYTQSSQIDEHGNTIGENYLFYTDDIDTELWKKNYTADGITELKERLVVKNTIPNVSAVVFRKKDITPLVETLKTFKVAGDWFFYVWLLEQGNIAFCSESHNIHRRHASSVTSEENKQRHFNEFVSMQEKIMTAYSVTDDVKLVAMEYRKHVMRQLGIY